MAERKLSFRTIYTLILRYRFFVAELSFALLAKVFDCAHHFNNIASPKEKKRYPSALATS